jgi:hypothetical protein
MEMAGVELAILFLAEILQLIRRKVPAGFYNCGGNEPNQPNTLSSNHLCSVKIHLKTPQAVWMSR